MLHIKGPAVHPGLRTSEHAGTDVDVIVRPSGVDALMAALAEHGWRIETTFDAGSAFDHAANLFHDSWGLLDVHRHYPGMDRDPAHAFDRLWSSRGSVALAPRARAPCPSRWRSRWCCCCTPPAPRTSAATTPTSPRTGPTAPRRTAS